MHTAQSLQAQNLEGLQYLLAKDYQKAIWTFEGILKQDPNNAKALVGIAKIFIDIGHEHKALEYLQKALLSEPRNTLILSLAAQIAVQVGRLEEAKSYAKQTHKLAPKSSESIMANLAVSQKTQDVLMTQKLAQQLLSQDKSPDAYNIAGAALESVGKITEAIRAFRNGIRLALATKSPPPQTPTHLDQTPKTTRKH